jgi:hypothetical protein
MPHPTSGRDHLRVVMHPRVCPDCGSGNVVQAEVDTGDGITETALTCRACGACWPVACVTDWPHPAQPDLTGFEHDPELVDGRLW